MLCFLSVSFLVRLGLRLSAMADLIRDFEFDVTFPRSPVPASDPTMVGTWLVYLSSSLRVRTGFRIIMIMFWLVDCELFGECYWIILDGGAGGCGNLIRPCCRTRTCAGP
jgi:hypothetical protein